MAKRIEVSKDIEQDKEPPRESWAGFHRDGYRTPQGRRDTYDRVVKGKPLTEKIKD